MNDTELLEPSVEPETSVGGGGTDAAPADAGSPKKRVWSFPGSDEKREARAPLTEEEWARVLRGKRHSMAYLVTREQREWAGDQARSCGTCKGVNLNGDPRRGWCLRQNMMTALTFPVLCRTWEAS